MKRVAIYLVGGQTVYHTTTQPLDELLELLETEEVIRFIREDYTETALFATAIVGLEVVGLAS